MRWRGLFPFFIVFLLSSPIYAQSAPSESFAEAIRLFEAAEADYKEQKYEAALEGYEGAYLLSKEPGLLFNIAQCYRLLGKKEEALLTYRRYLEEVPSTPYRQEI